MASSTDGAAGAVRENPYAKYIRAQPAAQGQRVPALPHSHNAATHPVAAAGPALPPPTRQVRKPPRVVEVDGALAAFVPTALRRAKRAAATSATAVQRAQRPAKRARAQAQEAPAAEGGAGMITPAAQRGTGTRAASVANPNASQSQGESANAAEPFESFLHEIEQM